MKKTTAKEVLIFVLSFAVPTLIFALCWANIGITYNGELTPLIYDMNMQYMPFMTSLRYVLNGENSIFFNWSVSLGGDYLSLFAYYLASPLNLLTVLWDVERMPQAIYVITLIKIGLCGLTFQTFLRFGLAKRKSSYVNIVFASCYALMSYNIVYSMCLMWLDGVILLPLILLGVEKLFEGKKGAAYFFSIFGCFYCNFYISYMVGIFTAVYFLTCVLRYWEKGCVKQMLVKAGRFTLLTLTALGLTLPMVLPALLSFAKGKGIATAGEGVHPDAYQFTVVELLMKFLPQQYDSIEYTGLPSIYCGSFIVLLAMLFLILKTGWREKVGIGVLLGVPFVGFVVPKVDILLHGFQFPHCFLFRYAFLFSTALLLGAYRCFWYLVEKHVSVKKQRGLIALLGGYLCIELFLNGSFIIGSLHEEANYHLKATFESEYTIQKPIIEYIKSQNDEKTFYRIGEQLQESSSNYSFLYDYMGAEYFGSTFNFSVNQFLNRVGKNGAYYRTTIKGVESFVQGLLGIKYVVTDQPLTYPYYREIYSPNNNVPLFAYENEKASTFGFLVDESSLQQERPIFQTAFQNANSIAIMLTGNEEEIYKPVDLTLESGYSEETKIVKYSFAGEAGASLFLDMEGLWTPSAKEKEDEFAKGSLSTENDEDNVEKRLLIHLDDNLACVGYFSYYLQKGLGLGKINNTGRHSLSFYIPDNLSIDKVEAFTLDEEALIHHIDVLMGSQVENVRKIKNGVYGKVDVSGEKRLVTSIPYDEGWTLLVDGEKTDICPIFGTFISVSLSEGNHEIELRYIPKGFSEGCVASLTSMFIVIIYFCMKRKQNVNIS